MIQITYKGTDITESVSINRCIHEMYASGQSDTLFLRVNDVDKLWDRWSPQIGDEIKVDYGSIGTGTMFLSSATPKNGVYDLEAQSAPTSGFVTQHKSWQKVRLLQLGQEIAERNGLTFASYGVEDRTCSYIVQDGEGDFKFLNRRARLEGCSILIFDKKLVMYSEQYMEAQEPSEKLEISLDGDFKYIDNRAELYGSCEVGSGEFSGSFSANNGAERVLRPSGFGKVGSNEEAERFAKNLLRHQNKGCCHGFAYSQILPGYAAASTVALINSRAPSWNGSIFIDRIRNDYSKGLSKIFFRKPLEGY